MNDNFCVFILTHGRPDNVITYETLKKSGYTGKIYIVIDNEDKKQEEYKKNFENVIVFDKLEVSKKFDQADTFEDRRAIVYARNVCFELAEKLNIKYFIQLDDDYTNFSFVEDAEGKYCRKDMKIKDLDKIFNILLDFFKNTNIKTIALGQGGDFIGGENSGLYKTGLKRKAMNSFICSTDRKFTFLGRINEDVNTYTRLGSVGDLFFTTSLLRLEQKQTQSNSGGMTDIYLDNGTYIKSFYTVLFMPSSVDIRLMGVSNKRLHHNIKWKNTVPMILSEKFKKEV